MADSGSVVVDPGFEPYVAIPYEAKNWLLPGTIIFFLVSLIIRRSTNYVLKCDLDYNISRFLGNADR